MQIKAHKLISWTVDEESEVESRSHGRHRFVHFGPKFTSKIAFFGTAGKFRTFLVTVQLHAPPNFFVLILKSIYFGRFTFDRSPGSLQYANQMQTNHRFRIFLRCLLMLVDSIE